MKKIRLIILLLFFPAYCFGADYEVDLVTETVDGSSFCGGACTKNDKIILKAGTRGRLVFQNFDGVDGYIEIVNEDTGTPTGDKVIINSVTESSHMANLIIENCSYIWLHGDNDEDILTEPGSTWADMSASGCGIKIEADGIPYNTGRGVLLTGCAAADGEELSNIKVSHIEITGQKGDKASGMGWQNNDSDAVSTDRYTNLDFSYLWVHHTRMVGMYLGENQDMYDTLQSPWINGFEMHHCLIEDTGSYGVNIKGIRAGGGVVVVLFHDNIIRRTGLHPELETRPLGLSPSYWGSGVGFAFFRDGSYANIYDNVFEDTPGYGLGLSGGWAFTEGSHLVHDNTFRRTNLVREVEDTGVDPDYSTKIAGGAIFLKKGINGARIYDNTIINPGDYGIFATDSGGYSGDPATDCLMSRNIICGWGYVNPLAANGEWLNEDDCTALSEEVGEENIASETCMFITNMYPDDEATGIPIGNNITWSNPTGTDDIDMYFEAGVNPPTTHVISSLEVTEYDPPADLEYETRYYWRVDVNHGIETTTGTVYYFTTIDDDGGGGPIKRYWGNSLIFDPAGSDFIFAQ